jgi:hypothetical protein
MPRETWSDILAYYLNYIEHMQPILEQTKRFLLNINPDDIIRQEVLDEALEKEEKRSVHKVKALSEFTAMYRREIFGMINSYVEEAKDDFQPIDIRDYTIDFLDECMTALRIMNKITNPDQKNLEKTLMYKIINFIQDYIFPQGKTKKEIYDILIEKSPEFYESQRHILKPTTFYRENLDENEIPGISPMIYRIINEITSLFNLDPNYLEMPEDDTIEIPVIMKNDVFEPFIDQLANKEEDAINKILRRMELRLIDGIFIGPTREFISLTEDHNYINRKQLSDGKTRIIPQFSNETLVLIYLAGVSFRRGFISKELINWISSNIAFLMYNSILKTKVSEDNIFYHIFTDLKTEEKILPYLMKLICFKNYLRIDYTKIRDSVMYRKELFNSLGAKIANLDKLTDEIVEFLEIELKKDKNL